MNQGSQHNQPSSHSLPSLASRMKISSINPKQKAVRRGAGVSRKFQYPCWCKGAVIEARKTTRKRIGIVRRYAITKYSQNFLEIHSIQPMPRQEI